MSLLFSFFIFKHCFKVMQRSLLGRFAHAGSNSRLAHTWKQIGKTETLVIDRPLPLDLGGQLDNLQVFCYLLSCFHYAYCFCLFFIPPHTNQVHANKRHNLVPTSVELVLLGRPRRPCSIHNAFNVS